MCLNTKVFTVNTASARTQNLKGDKNFYQPFAEDKVNEHMYIKVV